MGDVLGIASMWRSTRRLVAAAIVVAFIVAPEWSGEVFLMLVQDKAAQLLDALGPVLQSTFDAAARGG